MQNHRLLHFLPPASVSSQSAASAWARSMPGEVRDSRIWTGGSSRGLSPAARPLLLVDADRCAFRSSGPACTALSSIKQVVRLSHNFIVHFSPTEGHGAMEKNHRKSTGIIWQRRSTACWRRSAQVVFTESASDQYDIAGVLEAARASWQSICSVAQHPRRTKPITAEARNHFLVNLFANGLIPRRTEDPKKKNKKNRRISNPQSLTPGFHSVSVAQRSDASCGSSSLTIIAAWEREREVDQERRGVLVTSASSSLHPCLETPRRDGARLVDWAVFLEEKSFTLSTNNNLPPPCLWCLVDVGWGMCF